MYQPKPIDTRNVELSRDILELSEILAENTHDLWAQGRINEGWTYGPERNDSLKHHPCLVAYSELPESEKKYDRDISIETLKVILGMGYKITKEQ